MGYGIYWNPKKDTVTVSINGGGSVHIRKDIYTMPPKRLEDIGWTRYEKDINNPAPPLPQLSIVYPKPILALVNKIRANPKILIPYIQTISKGQKWHKEAA